MVLITSVKAVLLGLLVRYPDLLNHGRTTLLNDLCNVECFWRSDAHPDVTAVRTSFLTRDGNVSDAPDGLVDRLVQKPDGFVHTAESFASINSAPSARAIAVGTVGSLDSGSMPRDTLRISFFIWRQRIAFSSLRALSARISSRREFA